MAKQNIDPSPEIQAIAMRAHEKRKQEQLYAQAQIGFTLIKPWIAAQFDIDGDDIQVMEILGEVVEEAIAGKFASHVGNDVTLWRSRK